MRIDDAAADGIHARLGSLADETRTRLLLLLSRHELSVGELCAALRLPQSTVSRHLRVLADEGWVVTRSEGTSRYYRLARLDGTARRLWQVVRDAVAGRPESAHDEALAQQVLVRRRTRSQEFFSTAAGQWDAVREELFGAGAGPGALLALLPADSVVADLGCGTGVVSAQVAPFVGRVIAVDENRAMLAAARRRLGDRDNVELRPGSLESLPLEDGVADAAVLSLVLHYLPEPQHAIAEAYRILRPGGRLLVVDMMAHERADLRERLGHVWQGFREVQVRGWMEDCGFGSIAWHALPPDPQAKGPMLFAMRGTRPS